MKRYLSVFHSQRTASRFRVDHSIKRFFSKSLVSKPLVSKFLVSKLLEGFALRVREEVEGSTFVGMSVLCLVSVGVGYLLREEFLIWGVGGTLGIVGFVVHKKTEKRLFGIALLVIAFSLVYPSLRVPEESVVQPLSYAVTTSVEGTIEKASPVALRGGVGVRLLINVRSSPSVSEGLVRVNMRMHKENEIFFRSLRAGDTVKGRMRLMPLSRAFVPGGFSYQERFLRQGIIAVGYGAGDLELIKKAEGGKTMADFRYDLAWSFHEGLSEHPVAAGIVTSLVTGLREGIPKKTMKDIRSSGLSHLFAISGLHVGLLALFVMGVGMTLWSCSLYLASHYDPRIPVALLACSVAFVYMMMAGAMVPTQRAFIMLVIVCVALCMKRIALSRHLLSFAALCVIFISPEALFDAGFQMSFAATLAIIAFYQDIWLERDFSRKSRSENPWRYRFGLSTENNRPHAYIAGILACSLLASIATLPFVLYHFSFFPSIGILANLAGVSLVSLVILPLSFLVTLPVFFFGSDVIPFFVWDILAYSVDLLLWIAGTSAEISDRGGGVLEGAMGEISFGLMVLGVVIVFLLRTSLRYGGVILLLAGLVAYEGIQEPLPLVVVSGDRGVVGLIDEKSKTLIVRNGRESFVHEFWRRHYGLKRVEVWDGEMRAINGLHVICRGGGCFVNGGGKSLSIAGKALAGGTLTGGTLAGGTLAGEGWMESGDLHIAPFWYGEEGCEGEENVIDGDRLACLGSHEVYDEEGGWRVVSDGKEM